MIVVVVLFAAAVVFVLFAAVHVAAETAEEFEQRGLDAWLLKLRAEAPHEFAGSLVDQYARLPRSFTTGDSS